MQELVASPPPPVAEAADRVAFTGRRGEFVRLVMRGALLELVTVGFYRFWLATDMRRHLWSHTSVGRRRAGIYRHRQGAADRLFVRAWRSCCRSISPISSSAWKPSGCRPSPAFRCSCSSTCSPSSRSIAPAATGSRARSGAACVSAWRAPAGTMRGAAALWGLLVLLTLGLALPWRAAALERFKMRHTLLRRSAGPLRGHRLGSSSSTAGGSGCWRGRRSSFPSPCRSSTRCSRPSSGAGGCPASASARCASNPS